ncbi:AAA ATPase domain-containing protein [Nonomuraea solani]|uniref:AAA ATPase domain-containing protein n=1 Tax=Nonomuraea solani TaxID=1144553 RepID=A0A1H6EWT4_9ACTN|nr:LuxR family transcriptional regulator [Nonomuraea solani]SEH01551.1 AAA ATPase domain-containing protein [Nonomuraea solani]
MFVGRTAELALLRAELRAAGGGSARRVVVAGPEGIGKTAFINHALGGEAGARVLAVSGEESERELPLGVVRQVAEEAVLLGLAWAGPRLAGDLDPCAAGQAVCDVIGELQGRAPLTVLVDDAQWADQESLRALGYVLRRVRAGRVLVLVVCRDLADPWLPEGLRRLLTGDDTLRIALGGLGASDLADLALSLAPATDESAPGPAASAGSSWAARGVRPDGGGSGGGRPGSGRSGGDGWGAVSAASVAVRGSGALEGDERAAGLSVAAAVRLREHTLGNPLHARALLATVPAPVLDDRGVRLPAPGTYTRPFVRRLHACAPATRRLVAACAVLGGSCPLHVAVAVATGIGEPLAALEEAVSAGLLRELPGRLVDFPEPLARAAAYDGIGAGTRARLHLAASRLVDDAGQALRHRAAASGGPDEVLAEELAGFAAKAAQHGRWQEAAAHLDLAAGLTESAARRDELRTAALEHVLIGGDVIRATELAAARNADPRPVRRYVLGRLALARGRFDEASELLTEAWRHAEPGFAADVAEQMAWLRLVTGDRTAAVDWARLAIEQPIQGAVARPHDVLALGGAPSASTHSADPPAPDTRNPARTRYPPDARTPGDAHPPAEARNPGDARDPVDARTPTGAPTSVGARYPLDARNAVESGGIALAVAHLVADEPAQAGAVLKRVVAESIRAGVPHHRLLATALLAVAEHGMARWDDAAVRAEHALAEAVALGQAWLRPLLEVVCVAPLEARGEHERALAHATAATAAARQMCHALGERQADLAMALLGAGDAPGGGAPKEQPSGQSGGQADEGALDVFVPDPRPGRIEALVADGRLEEAEQELAAFDEAVLGSGPLNGAALNGAALGVAVMGGAVLGRAAYAEAAHSGVAFGGTRRPGVRRRAERGRLGGLVFAARNVPERAEEAFGRALALVGAGVCPLEEARVLLDLGRLLRRTGRRRAAAERLGAARAIFERLGARPLVERCAQELEACGLEPPATVRLGLTPQELSTATLVAGGLTNRQIARELLISVKTVEYHIGKIYTKLGIGSRVALAAKLAAFRRPA